MKNPKLACCNFIPDVAELYEFAIEHGFNGIDWTFHREDLPQSSEDVQSLRSRLVPLHPMEFRYHIAFNKTDLGNADVDHAKEAMRIFRQVCRVVAEVGGKVVTIHVGLGRDSTLDLSWDRTIESLSHLVRYADSLGLKLCLENLAWGWTSRPELFEKLVRKAGPWTTLDIGHAQISPSVMSQEYTLEDFIAPQAERFLNAHIYHIENELGHIPPDTVDQLRDRLCLLRGLPNCDWWVLELRKLEPLLQTLEVVRAFLEEDPCEA